MALLSHFVNKSVVMVEDSTLNVMMVIMTMEIVAQVLAKLKMDAYVFKVPLKLKVSAE